VHEVAHGIAALKQGDETAKRAGRLSMNPLVHIDIIGSIILPFVLIQTGSPFLFGYAKPVPVNTYNFKDQKYGNAKVAFAGPLSNLLLALIFFIISFNYINDLVVYTIFINVFLAIINLFPIPPLDGSKIANDLFPKTYGPFYRFIEDKGFIAQFLLIILAWNVFIPIIYRLIASVVL